MHALLLALALNAQPVLEPDPGGYKRLQPRQLDASSFLSNGWNKFEQNYLPLYAADDDPATAWVEGAAGPGEGESLTWFGPRLQKARAFRVFVRAGYQKSAALLAANARPRKVRLEPLAPGEAAPLPAGKPVEVELADVAGWQKVELPVPAAVTGFRLTVLSVYPGSQYQDLCISDVRVYVDGDDPYSPAAEAQAAERIRAFVAERQAAAAAGATSAVELAPRYKAVELGRVETRPTSGVSGALVAALTTPAPEALYDVFLAARQAALAYQQGLDQKTLTQHPTRLALAVKGLGGRSSALATAARADPGLAQMLRYLATGDLAAFEGTGATQVLDPESARVAGLQALSGTPRERCLPECKRGRDAWKGPGDYFSCFHSEAVDAINTCADFCQGQPHYVCDTDGSREENRGVYVLGSLKSPQAIYRHASVYVGDRMGSSSSLADELIAYEGGLARSLVSVREEEGEEAATHAQAVYLFTWTTAAGKRPRLSAITRLRLEGNQVVVTRFEAV